MCFASSSDVFPQMFLDGVQHGLAGLTPVAIEIITTYNVHTYAGRVQAMREIAHFLADEWPFETDALYPFNANDHFWYFVGIALGVVLRADQVSAPEQDKE